MKSALINTMVRGWFVGNFNPSALKTDICEVGVKSYKAGEYESAHFHKIATEVTLILSGSVRMFEREWGSGDIIIIEPNDVTEFYAITDTVSVVVKIPGALNDKYLV